MARQGVRRRQGRRSKYAAVPTTVDGIRFHSKAESRRYVELKLLEKAGEIRKLTLQPRFALCCVDWRHLHFHVTTATTGDMAVGEYRADFGYIDVKTDQPVIEDVKGFRTPLYKWKKKHVEAQYGIQIREIR